MNSIIDTCAGCEIIESSSLKHTAAAIKQFQADKVFIICDTNTRKHCYSLIEKFLPAHTLITIPQGEKNKTWVSATKLWDTLLKHTASKRSLLVALGGGVVTDIAGFAASVYKRGIPTVYIPTTLLAQADAAIGGKTGIDYQSIKNTIGTIYHPRAVFIYNPFLKTLPQAHLHNGMAEIIKIGAAWNAELFYDVVDNKRISKALINKAIATKCQVVNDDVRDTYLRKALNFGHTLGHAIEAAFMDKKNALLHGEAIALGMIGEAYLSYNKTGMPIEDLDDILYVLNKWELIKPVKLNAVTKEILKLCKQDKKNADNTVNGVLLKSIGAPVIDVTLSDGDIKQALVYTDNYIKSL